MFGDTSHTFCFYKRLEITAVKLNLFSKLYSFVYFKPSVCETSIYQRKKQNPLTEKKQYLQADKNKILNFNSTIDIWYFLSLLNNMNLCPRISELVSILTDPWPFHQVRNLSVFSYTSATLMNPSTAVTTFSNGPHHNHNQNAYSLLVICSNSVITAAHCVFSQMALRFCGIVKLLYQLSSIVFYKLLAYLSLESQLRSYYFCHFQVTNFIQ